MKITLHERKIPEMVKEAEGLQFLSDELTEKLDFYLPSCYYGDALAVCKCSEELEPDVEWDIEDISLDVDRATVSGDYLMIVFKGNPGKEKVQQVLNDEYKKAVLAAAPEVVQYIDLKALKDALNTIQDESEGEEWEINYNLGDIQDLSDVPGVCDACYAENTDGLVSIAVSVTGFAVADPKGEDIKYTKDAGEAKKFLQEYVEKYKV